MRIEIAKELDDKTDLIQHEIAECLDRSQQWVSKALRDRM